MTEAGDQPRLRLSHLHRPEGLGSADSSQRAARPEIAARYLDQPSGGK